MLMKAYYRERVHFVCLFLYLRSKKEHLLQLRRVRHYQKQYYGRDSINSPPYIFLVEHCLMLKFHYTFV